MEHPLRFWLPQGQAMADAKAIMEAHDRWLREARKMAKSVGGTCTAIGRGFRGYYLAGVAFASPPDESRWKKVDCREGVAYAPKRLGAARKYKSSLGELLDFMDHNLSDPQRQLQKRFAPKNDCFLQSMGAEFVGNAVVLTESFGWNLRDCERISDMDYESMVEASKKKKAVKRKAGAK